MIRANEIAMENSKTGKVTAVVAILGGPVLKLAKIKFAPNAIFRVVSCLYILYDLTYSFLWKKSNHSLR